MKTHTKPALIPGQNVYFVQGGTKKIVLGMVDYVEIEESSTRYHILGWMGNFEADRLHHTFESALAALK